MPEKHLPFMLPVLATVTAGGKVNVARLVEAFIIAAVTAMVTMWGVQKQTEIQIQNLSATVSKMEASEQGNISEVKSQVGEVRRLVEQHIMKGAD